MANGIVGQIHVNDADYLIGSTLYGECTNLSNEPIKQVVLKNNALYNETDGLTIHVKFTYGNTINNNSLKLQIRNGGTSGSYTYSTEHPITNPNGILTWQENCIISFTYDGTSWVINSAATSSGITSITPGAGLINSTTSSQDAITSTGTISIAEGGVTNDMLQNDSITINNRKIVLGSDSVSLAELGITEVMHFKGTTTTAIGPTTTATIIINETSYTASAGDVILYNGKEYIWTGSEWEELGDESSFVNKIGAKGDLLIWTNTDTIGHLTIPSPLGSNTFLTINNGLPSWSTFSAGDNISLSTASGTTTLTIAASNDAVAQIPITIPATPNNDEYPILLKNNPNTTNETNGVHYVEGITINPSTGTINAKIALNNINGISSEPLTFSAISVVSSSSSQTNNATQLGEVQNGVLYIHALSITNSTEDIICKNNNNNNNNNNNTP